jgi:hypothetical protein
MNAESIDTLVYDHSWSDWGNPHRIHEPAVLRGVLSREAGLGYVPFSSAGIAEHRARVT